MIHASWYKQPCMDTQRYSWTSCYHQYWNQETLQTFYKGPYDLIFSWSFLRQKPQSIQQRFTCSFSTKTMLGNNWCNFIILPHLLPEVCVIFFPALTDNQASLEFNLQVTQWHCVVIADAWLFDMSGLSYRLSSFPKGHLLSSSAVQTLLVYIALRCVHSQACIVGLAEKWSWVVSRWLRLWITSQGRFDTQFLLNLHLQTHCYDSYLCLRGSYCSAWCKVTHINLFV